MTNDYRAMCAELVDSLHKHTSMWENHEIDLVARARALLAQPEPVAPKPLVDYSRVPEIATEAQIRSAAQYLVKKRNCDGDLIPAIEYAIARWGNPTPQPPAAGDVAVSLIELRSTVMGLGQMGMHVAAKVVERAADLLERQHPQPVAEGPTDEEIEEWADACPEAPLEEIDPEIHGWRRCFTAKEFSDTIRAALDRWGNSQGILDSSPQPVWADIHYAWELEDADGEWQAGGSANSLEDVQREGNRYLQTYAQDGPHKLIIQRHCVNTIEEVTND